MLMNSDELSILLSEEFRALVAEHAERDPLQVALDRRIPHAALVASQLKYRRRAQRKLPSYVEAGCLFPPRAFEQASSEAAAATKHLAGDSLLDLTCGLGVDTLHFSRSFRRVVALERDPELATITRENLRRLGANHVEVICTSAEEYLARCEEHFDWVYADPDRRSAEGRKLVRLEDCSPDVVALRPLIERVAPRLCLKNSPLFDVDEAFRYFPEAQVEVISLRDECKEVIIRVEGSEPKLVAEAVGIGRVEVPLAERDATPSSEGFDPARYRWLIVPDVALQKARLVCHHLRPVAFVASENGFAFAEEYPEAVLGRVMEIAEIVPYKPKELKKEMKGTKAELWKRDFPLSLEEIRRQTGVREGADLRLAFTKIDGKNWMIRLK